MNRRSFMKRMFGLAVTIAAHPYIPLPKTAYNKLAQYSSLYGIPYHQSDASTGTWLGITRSTEPWWRSDIPTNKGGAITKETMNMIKKLMEDKT